MEAITVDTEVIEFKTFFIFQLCNYSISYKSNYIFQLLCPPFTPMIVHSASYIQLFLSNLLFLTTDWPPAHPLPPSTPNGLKRLSNHSSNSLLASYFPPLPVLQIDPLPPSVSPVFSLTLLSSSLTSHIF